jgi:transcription elongation factor GreA
MRAPITLKGAQRLREELDHLKSVKRPKVIAAIAEAREHGDLKENAEYHAAREEQGFIEGRIKQLEGELSHAEIIDVSKLNAGSKVVFGASVTLADVETDEEKKYQIVGDLEADIKLGLIAISSPVARAMIGKLEGDSIVIDAPAGQREYEIVSVSYVDCPRGDGDPAVACTQPLCRGCAAGRCGACARPCHDGAGRTGRTRTTDAPFHGCRAALAGGRVDPPARRRRCGRRLLAACRPGLHGAGHARRANDGLRRNTAADLGGQPGVAAGAAAAVCRCRIRARRTGSFALVPAASDRPGPAGLRQSGRGAGR